MADIAKFVEEIKSMTVLELNELVKAIEVCWRKQDQRYQGC